jgi:hypothetical protein
MPERLTMPFDLGRRLRHPGRALVAPLIAIGFAGSVVALSDRSADSLFVYHQQNLAPVAPSALEHLMTLASNPRPGERHARATSASCTPGASGELRNPWVCAVHYLRGGTIVYETNVSANGQVTAVDPTGSTTFHGCCIGPGAVSQ